MNVKNLGKQRLNFYQQQIIFSIIPSPGTSMRATTDDIAIEIGITINIVGTIACKILMV